MSAVPLAVVSKSEGKAKADTPATAATKGCPQWTVVLRAVLHHASYDAERRGFAKMGSA